MAVACLELQRANYSATARKSSKPALRTSYGVWLSTMFRRNVDQWYDDVFVESSISAMTEYDSFRSVVRLGSAAVPLIFAELSRRPSFLMLALEEILGESPVPAEYAGDLRRSLEAWMTWYNR